MKKINVLDYIEPFIGDTFQPVSLADIAEIELKLARKLPKDYVEFLQKYGRCGFSEDAVAGPSILLGFLGGGRDSGSLLSSIDFYKDLTADGKLVIADDMMGNPYVLDPLTGTTSYIDFTSSGPIGHHLATSFSDFLEKIEIEPE